MRPGTLSLEGEKKRGRERCFVLREGDWCDKATLLRSPVRRIAVRWPAETFGRFPISGPAAWRADGGFEQKK